jgi:hypothetical protein
MVSELAAENPIEGTHRHPWAEAYPEDGVATEGRIADPEGGNCGEDHPHDANSVCPDHRRLRSTVNLILDTSPWAAAQACDMVNSAMTGVFRS